MSVVGYNRDGYVISVCDALNGQLIDTFRTSTYNMGTIERCFTDLFYKYVVDNQHGLLIKIGSNDQ